MTTIAFDFDGVFTDLSGLRSARVSINEYLYSPVAIVFAQPRPGIVELLSLLGLAADIIILTARPREDREYLDEWLQKQGIRPLISDILCCGDERKTALMERYGISLIVDDSLTEVREANSEFIGIHWDSQSWMSVALDVFSRLIVNKSAEVKLPDVAALTSVQLATVWGSSQVFLMQSEDSRRIKVRVCSTYEERDKLLGFLQMTARHEYRHVARLLAVNGLAVVKSFIAGTNICNVAVDERRRSITKAGMALAALHAIPRDKSLAPVSLSLRDEEECLLVCAADNENLIVTPEGDVAFVDLGACASGPRGVDLCWADELLCKDEQERELFRHGYLSGSALGAASAKEMESASRSFRIWLTQQLLYGLDVHQADPAKRTAMSRAVADLWV